MKIIEKIRDHLWKKSVNQVLKTNNRKKRSIGLSQAKSIGIYTEYKNDKQFQQIQFFIDSLRQKGVFVDCLLYVDAKIKPEILSENSHLCVFTRCDLHFSRIPKIEKLDCYKRFINQDFNLLLDLSLDFNHQDVYIMAASKASFKVGKNVNPWSEKVNDLSFSFPSDTSLNEYIDLIMKYIENFKFDSK